MNIWDALIPAAAGIGSALIGANAAESAGDAATQAAQQSAAVQRYMFDTARGDMAPWRQAGGQAVGRLAQYVNQPFETSPGYQFRFNEGLRALDRSAASRGMLMSGAQARAAQRYGQGIGAAEYNDYINRLAALSGTGQTASAQTGALGAQAGQGIGNAYLQGGQMRGAAEIMGANAINSGIGNALYSYMRYGRGG